MRIRKAGCSLAVFVAHGVLAAPARATPVALDTTSPLNGVTDIYSATFDPALTPCFSGAPSYCAFFGGNPPATRALVITPNPTTVVNGIPDGIGPTGVPSNAAVPPAGSFLDLELSNDHTSVTLAGGTVATPVLGVTINGTTDVTATNAGFTFPLAPQTAPLDANGRAEFLVNLASPALVDFSHFPVVVTQCTGPLCSLILILNLDMIRYRLVIDYDDSFSSFTGDFIGQTANNSLVFATLNAGSAAISVSDGVAPTDDQQMPFGQVSQGSSVARQVTVTNTGGGSLAIGDVGAVETVAAPFSISDDNCSNQNLAKDASCTVEVTFAPAGTGDFTDSVDIPSSAGSVSIALSGTGTAAPVPVISVTDSTGDAADNLVAFGTQSTGSQSTATVTVANEGSAALDLGTLTAPVDPQFTIANDTCSGQSVAAGGSCTFDVQFVPATPASLSDTIDVLSNDPDEPVVTLSLTGTGVGPAIPNIRLSDPTPPGDDHAVSFDNVRVDGSFDRVFTVTNAGGLDLQIGSIAAIETLSPAQNCNFSVRFQPTSIDDFSGSFDVPSNDPDEPSITVTVSGAGVEDPVPTSPSPDGASSGFMALDPAALALIALGGALRSRRLRPLL
jgi:hypothetical protein